MLVLLITKLEDVVPVTELILRALDVLFLIKEIENPHKVETGSGRSKLGVVVVYVVLIW